MPLRSVTGSKQETENNFDEFRHGKTFKKTAKKFGKKRAEKQMIAVVLSNKRAVERKKGGKS